MRKICLIHYHKDADDQTSPLLTATCSLADMSSCVLDEQNFRRCCRLLLQQSEQLNDGWSWEPVQVRRSVLSLSLKETEPGGLLSSTHLVDGRVWSVFRTRRRVTWGKLLSGQLSSTPAQCGTWKDQVQSRSHTLPVTSGLISWDMSQNRWVETHTFTLYHVLYFPHMP